MRLEIIHQDGDTEVLEFSKKTLLVGRGSKCDLRITGEGISREHCELKEQEGQFFVTDLGSSNGTFVNEERIAPNTPTEFNTFFPIIVGAGTSISLLGEDDARVAMKPKIKATTAKVKEPTVTSLLVNNPTEYRPTGKVSASKEINPSDINDSHTPSEPSKKTKKSNSTLLIVLFAAAALYYFWFPESEQQQPPQLSASSPPPIATGQPSTNNEQVQQQKIDPTSVVTPKSIMNESKCLTQQEKSYCSNFSFQDYYSGFVIKNDTLFAAIHLDNYKKDFTFENPLQENEKKQLEQLQQIEQRAKSRNVNFKGFSATENEIQTALLLSPIFNQNFFDLLLRDEKIAKVYLVGFKRVNGQPIVINNIVTQKSKFLSLKMTNIFTAFKMMIIGQHNQLYQQQVTPIIQSF